MGKFKSLLSTMRPSFEKCSTWGAGVCPVAISGKQYLNQLGGGMGDLFVVT